MQKSTWLSVKSRGNESTVVVNNACSLSAASWKIWLEFRHHLWRSLSLSEMCHWFPPTERVWFIYTITTFNLEEKTAAKKRTNICHLMCWGINDMHSGQLLGFCSYMQLCDVGLLFIVTPQVGAVAECAAPYRMKKSVIPTVPSFLFCCINY